MGKVIKAFLPVVGAIAGGAIGGPVGAAIGGGIGGAASAVTSKSKVPSLSPPPPIPEAAINTPVEDEKEIRRRRYGRRQTILTLDEQNAKPTLLGQ